MLFRSEGALRELKEETGLVAAYIEQFHTFSDPQRDPRERGYHVLVSLSAPAGVSVQEGRVVA